ncbi:hypothetical protein M9979_14445 [Sphingomonas sp. RP10(2022)]|uniref:UrcA family protein n=1 Tax=Sphingomonas liriopis TaxID=2949094 RepID=A0A9X2HXJ2_9SPHN|nr:hypothetical protein [Sphingomonas liriopis]MCP3736071.1 hypothetical protein [Sphingomonas liriopis]
MKSFALLALAVATLSGTAAVAAPADQYVAVPAAASAKTSFITRSTVWRSQNGGFVAGSAPERPAVLCELVVRQVGALTSFAVAGRAYDADQLAKCNAKAKKG